MSEVRLTDICSPKQWKTISTEQLTDEGYPVYGANGIIGKYPEYNHDTPVITITCRGATCGTVHITQEKSYVTGNSMCLDDLRTDVNPSYLFYLLRHYNFSSIISGSAQPQITRQGLAKVIIRLDPPDRQAFIAGTLKKVEAVLKVRQAQLTALDELVKCRFVEMFGNPIINERDWNYSPLPKLADFVLGSTPKSSEPEYWDGDIKWLTPAELEDTTFIVYDSVRHITEAGVKAAGLKPFPAGTVIFSTRAPIGKTAIAGCEMYCNQGFKNFICGPRLDPVYLFSVLRIYKDYFIDLGTGTTFKELSKARLEKISIAVPPMESQKVFEQFYRRVDKLRFVSTPYQINDPWIERNMGEPTLW